MGRRRLATWGTVAVVTTIVLASLAGPASAVAPTPVTTAMRVDDACGDADGDRTLGVTDAVRVLGAAAGLLSTCAPERCDLDGNGAVTVTDGVGVLTRAAGLHFWEYYRCPVPSETVDFSEFARFTLSREPALGYCPEIGSVLSADIARQDDGAYIARLAVAVERPLGGPDDCEFTFDPVGAPTCIGGEPQPDRTLTPDEAEGLRSAFAAVEVYEARPPICAIAVFDPCIIDHFEWDGVRADDYPCSGRRVDFTTAKALIETLNGLIVP